jgi:hypothetical protein
MHAGAMSALRGGLEGLAVSYVFEGTHIRRSLQRQTERKRYANSVNLEGVTDRSRQASADRPTKERFHALPFSSPGSGTIAPGKIAGAGPLPTFD